MKIEGFAGGGNLNLTLTSVVFESFPWTCYFYTPYYLTLTSVVFESPKPIAPGSASPI